MLIHAVLLLGPTGAGKSPLGLQIEKNGICGLRCFHFDFGHELRSIANFGHIPEGFQTKDLSFIRNVLHKGLLLENEDFHIAEKVMLRFFRRKDFRRDDILLLNGLPRHADQAKAMESIVDVRSLIVIECIPGEVHKRIQMNTGRDRAGRADDSCDMISRKLELFHSRTAPLIDYYTNRGCGLLRIQSTSLSTPEEAYDAFIAAYSG